VPIKSGTQGQKTLPLALCVDQQSAFTGNPKRLFDFLVIVERLAIGPANLPDLIPGPTDCA
jgi:hypothetical protein